MTQAKTWLSKHIWESKNVDDITILGEVGNIYCMPQGYVQKIGDSPKNKTLGIQPLE